MPQVYERQQPLQKILKEAAKQTIGSYFYAKHCSYYWNATCYSNRRHHDEGRQLDIIMQAPPSCATTSPVTATAYSVPIIVHTSHWSDAACRSPVVPSFLSTAITAHRQKPKNPSPTSIISMRSIRGRQSTGKGKGKRQRAKKTRQGQRIQASLKLSGEKLV